MSRILPYPVLSLSLLAMWCLLHNSVSPATLLSGGILALIAPRTLLALEAERLMLKRPLALLKLAGIVIFDMIRSNFAVATIIYGRKRSTRAGGFIAIPLDMRSRYGLSILATIVTCTPGTLWAEYDSSRSRVLLHVLDVVEPDYWVALIKGRYERLLLEAFE